MALQVAEKYVDAFSNIAKESTTVLLPSNTNDPSSMVASALSIFANIQNKQNKKKENSSVDGSNSDDESPEEYTLDTLDEQEPTKNQ